MCWHPRPIPTYHPTNIKQEVGGERGWGEEEERGERQRVRETDPYRKREGGRRIEEKEWGKKGKERGEGETKWEEDRSRSKKRKLKSENEQNPIDR